MRSPHLELYVHLVWATWDRLPLITPDLEPRLHAALYQQSRALSCDPLAIGGIADHVHLLLRLPSTASVAAVVKALKGSSSHLVTHSILRDTAFKWQGAYGAFSVGTGDVETVQRYVARQREHHATRSLIPAWEQVAVENESPN
jgi:putative transposase